MLAWTQAHDLQAFRHLSRVKKQGKYIGICGQSPSDHPDFARWMMDVGVETVSLNPDSVVETLFYLAGQS